MQGPGEGRGGLGEGERPGQEDRARLPSLLGVGLSLTGPRAINHVQSPHGLSSPLESIRAAWVLLWPGPDLLTPRSPLVTEITKDAVPQR